MPQQFAGPNGGPPPMNGYGDHHSPSSSQLSVEGDGAATLISRTQKQHTTQQVTTTTKTIREVQYLGPDGQPLNYVPANGGIHPRLSSSGGSTNYEPISGYPEQYRDYEQYANGGGGGGVNNSGLPTSYTPVSGVGGSVSEYPDFVQRPPTPPSPSDRSNSPPPQHREPDYLRSGSSGSHYPPRSGYDELDTTLMPPVQPQNGGGRIPRYSSVDGSAAQGSLHSYNANDSVFEDQGQDVSPGSQQPQPQPQQQLLHHQSQQSLGAPPRANFDDEIDETMSQHQYQQDQQIYLQQQQDEEDQYHQQQQPLRVQTPRADSRGVPGVHWRDPDLHEVIEFLNNPNSVIKANAAAYLQHLCYMDDPVKAKTRQLGGIPPLVALLSHDIPEIHRNACGALRNLSYGRQNDENKRAIKNAGGIQSLVRLLRKTADNEVKDLVTGVLWNLSSCDDLKRAIIDDALLVLVNIVIIPHSGWDPKGPSGETHWTTVLRNSTGILRNVSSAGDYGRKKLRECEGLVDSVLYLVKNAIEKANIDNKSVENAVCVLRNLSYRAQEVEDPNYDKKQLLPAPGESRAGAKPNSDNLGCFGASKSKRKDHSSSPQSTGTSSSTRQRTGPVKGMELLWQPEVVQPYLSLLSNCSNPETLEAAAGAIQNLSACYWQPSIDVRAAVRKEKGLPILVELLRMEVDRVVCAVATALRNLAIDQRNKELIGKYAMRDLVQKLPSGNPQNDNGTSDDTVAAVLATLNEVIKKHPEFSRSLLEAGGVDRLMNITRQRQRYTSRVVKFASQVLYSMWVHIELREVYRKAGWKEADFVTKTVAARNARPNSPTNLNSTLNRPMASQSGTRYEDRSMPRGGPRSVSGGRNAVAVAAAAAAAAPPPGSAVPHLNNSAGYVAEEVPMENLSLYGVHAQQLPPQQMYPAAAAGGNHLAAAYPGEPVYAQVNRDRKKRGLDPQPPQPQQPQQQYISDYSNEHWQVSAAGPAVVNHHGVILDQAGNNVVPPGQTSNEQAGDSWV